MEKRRKIADRYLKSITNLKLPYQHPDTNSCWHLFVIQAKDRNQLYQKLKEKGIVTQVHYIPVNKQPFYNLAELEHSTHLYNHCLSIPIYVDLTNEDQLKIIDSL